MNSSQDVLGRFTTKAGNQCVVTKDKVVWMHGGGHMDQLFIREITGTNLSETGIFSKAYRVTLYHDFRAGRTGVFENAQWTEFATRSDAEQMLQVVQAAMILS